MIYSVADPLLGVFTGFLAYYLAEKNPRSAPPPGERLIELLYWKREEFSRKRAEKEALLEEKMRSQNGESRKES